MTKNRMQLLRMCRGFFLQTTIFTAICIGGCFYTFNFYGKFGLSLMIFGSLGILPFFFKNTYWIIDDIFKMNTEISEGKIVGIVYSDILPYRVMIANKKNKGESGSYHLDVKKKNQIPVGSWVKIRYLKKSKIIVEFEVIKFK